MFRLGLTHRLLFVTLVTLAPMAALMFVNIYATRQSAWEAMHDSARRTGLLTTLEMGQIVTGIESVLISSSSSPSVRSANTQLCSEFVSTIVSKLPQLVAITIAHDGDLICVSGPADSLPPQPDAESVDYARNAKEARVGHFQAGDGARPPTLPVIMTIEVGGRELTFVGFLNLNWFGLKLKTHPIGEGGSITMADHEGTIFAREPRPEEFVGNSIPPAFIHLVNETQPGSLPVVSQDGTRRVIGYHPASQATKGVYVSAGVAMDQILAPIDRITALTLLIGSLTIVAALIAAQIVNARVIRRPFSRLIATLEAWQAGNTDMRTGLDDDPSEFGQAGRALDGFMNQLLAAREERRVAEEQRALLLREHDHRMKNLITTVQAVARQTFRGDGIDGKVRTFTERLAAMAKAHETLLSGGLQAASVAELIATAIAPFNDPARSRFITRGPDFELADKAATALAMALHELCTNAAKYGALSTPEGHVRIEWALQDEGTRFRLDWMETGGPAITPPKTNGFGTTMIKTVLSQHIGGTVDMTYNPGGLHCRIEGSTAGT